MTQDQSWSEESCKTKEDCVPVLLKELTVSSTRPAKSVGPFCF